jgi:hypothetical protein
MRSGGFHGSAVLVLREVIPNVGMREVLEELDSVAASAEVYKAGLVEGPVQYLQRGSILPVLQTAVVERQALVFHRYDYQARSAQDMDIEGTFLFGPEGVLDDVQADQLDGPVHRLGIPQAEPTSYLLHELDHRRQEPGVSGDSDAGDWFLWRCFHFSHRKSFFKTTSRIRNSILSGLVGIDQTGGSRVQQADKLALRKVK